MSLMTILTASGLAFGAGQRAGLVALALGLAHYTGYFTLGSRFEWLASPPVLAILGLLAIVELLADWFPEVNEFSEAASALPRVVVGFIGAAAAVGTVEPSIKALVASGILGSTVSYAMHRASSSVRSSTRDIDDSADHAASVSTTASAAALSGAAIFAPLLVLPVLVISGIAAIALVALFRRLRRAIVDTTGMVDDGDAAA